MQIGERRFEFTRGFDVIRDGMFLQVDDVTSTDAPTTVMEAFWRESDGQITMRMFEPELPFELVEMFVAQVRPALTPVDRGDHGNQSN